MTWPPTKANARRPPGASQITNDNRPTEHSTTRPHRYEVQIVNPATGRPTTFSTHDTREAAELEAAKLRSHKMFAQVRRVDAQEAAP